LIEQANNCGRFRPEGLAVGNKTILSRGMKHSVYRLANYIKRSLWALVVCYMLGLHNFYHGDDKTPDDIIITTEVNEVRESGRLDD
jgi:hypothetical protein